MKVYVVTDGEYSDRRTMGIYSTEEKAKDARRLYASDNEVEEYELDLLPAHPPGMLRYWVRMDIQGNVSEMVACSAEAGIDYDWLPHHDRVSVDFHVWATDEIHAAKIANEKRAQLVATNEWTTSWDEWYKRKLEKEPIFNEGITYKKGGES